MIPTPISTAISAWYGGPLDAQMQAALTVNTPAPDWFWLGIGIGIAIGIILVIGADAWRARRR